MGTRMSNRFRIVGAGLLLAIFRMSAAAEAWSQEPATVFGIKLGAAATEIKIPACLRADVYGKGTTICISGLDGPYAKEFLKIENTGLSFASSATVYIHRGLVTSIGIEFDQSSFASAKVTLTEKYGQAHQSGKSDVRANGGAVLSSEMALWIGKENSITLAERRGRIDMSHISFENKAATDAWNRDLVDRAKKDANAL
jgi:hypothetical protein